jgi:D-proline reductase (dithiol) PrdB
MCTRTVCTLAHTFEAAGLATLALVSNRAHAERLRPPRALYCDFPLGRPLGRPGDAGFQHEVLRAGFQLFGAEHGPVLVDFPEVISDETDAPAQCPLPPRYDEHVPAAIEEARALRPAWDRSFAVRRATQVGRVVTADEIPAAIGRFIAMADGEWWDEAGFGTELEMWATAVDVRAYYEEAALSLVDHVPAARSTESWFYQRTQTGRLFKHVADAIEASDRPVTYRAATKSLYIVPAPQRADHGYAIYKAGGFLPEEDA